ncbi:hypothetical protein [Kangiella marina]|uniref:HEPN domain-containing protein n=1 Tax=Kangiella marina TaxID=1079178 RepID=A0ABP8ID90_9GAMM
MDKVALDNLVKINELKHEAPDQSEFNGLVQAANNKLKDSQSVDLSDDSRFSLAYGAAFALSRAALRYCGYRTDKRYIVFQCLQHTVGLEKAKWRVLDKCHQVRNLAEYEGYVEIDNQLLKELIEITEELKELVERLPPL